MTFGEAEGDLPLGSSASKWNGEAVCATASMSLTASSNAPSYGMVKPRRITEGARHSYLSDVLDNDRFKFVPVGGEEFV